MTNNTKWLLAIVGLLVLLRFVVVPAMSAQQELLDERQKYQSQIARSKHVLEKADQYDFMLLKASANLDKLQSEFPIYQDASEFRFQYQRSIEQLAKRHNVRITRADWREQQSEVITNNLQSGEFLMFVKGHGLDVMNFHRQLNRLSANTKVSSLRLQISEFGNEPMELIEGPMSLTVFYRTEAEG